MSAENLGRALDKFSTNVTQAMQPAIDAFRRAMRDLSRPDITVEGRRLTEDLSRERYDLVERSSVRVERVPAQTTDGEAARVRYHDGSEWSDVTRYDLAAIDTEEA